MKNARLTEADVEALEGADIANPRVVRTRWDAMGYPNRLIEGESIYDFQTYRGWWHEGEGVEDIEFLAEMLNGWPSEVGDEE